MFNFTYKYYGSNTNEGEMNRKWVFAFQHNHFFSKKKQRNQFLIYVAARLEIGCLSREARPWGRLDPGAISTLGPSRPWGHLDPGAISTLGPSRPWGRLDPGAVSTLGSCESRSVAKAALWLGMALYTTILLPLEFEMGRPGHRTWPTLAAGGGGGVGGVV